MPQPPLNWFAIAVDQPFRYVEELVGRDEQDVMSSHPGAFDIRGPFASEFQTDQWLQQNPHWPHWPGPPPKHKPPVHRPKPPPPPSGGSGGGPNPPPPPSGPPLPKGPLGKRGQRMTGALIARIALRYVGRGYVYGGNASAVGVWDCSSFVSYVLHQAGLSLPGGKWGDPGFPPNVHGPVVVSYADWAGATTVTMPEAGDLVCYVGEGVNGHIGIAISATEMVSALDPTDGTQRTPIFPPRAGQPRIYRRVNGLAGGGVVGGGGGQGAAQHPPLQVVGVVAGLFAAAAFAVAGVVAAVVFGGRKLMEGSR